MFDGFRERRVAVNEVEIACVEGGAGPAVLLLHGAPQTHAMWNDVASGLAAQYTVVASDLRGYGDSSKPPGGSDHSAYSFRTMAQDQVDLMAQLGHDRYAVVGHDRGARVTHRLLLDHPERVTRAAVLDILPTAFMYGQVTLELAAAYWHWFTFIQPEPLPEDLIGGDPVRFLHHALHSFGSTDAVFADDAMREYERCFKDPAMVHAMCEDYRAAVSIDLEHDRASADQRVACPLLVVWGARGVLTRFFDPLEVWRQFATDVRGQALDAGHFLAEERPADTLRLIQAFLE